MSLPHYSPDCEEHHGLVRDFGGSADKMARPKIVVLCGSTRFVGEFNRQGQILTEAGVIVLSIEIVTTQARDEDPQHCDPGRKARLDELHKRKIDLADEVLVLNVGGYIGESTRSEIAYAESIGRMVFYLEHEVGWPTVPADRGDDFVADPRAGTHEALAEAVAGATDAEAERLTFVPATPENILAVIAENEARIDAVLGRRPQGAVSPGAPDWVPGFGPVPGSGLE